MVELKKKQTNKQTKQNKTKTKTKKKKTTHTHIEPSVSIVISLKSSGISMANDCPKSLVWHVVNNRNNKQITTAEQILKVQERTYCYYN